MICPKCGDDFWTGESVCGRCGEPPVRSSEIVGPREYCAEYSRSVMHLAHVLSVAHEHKMPYTGAPFRFCPWCGIARPNAKLRDAGESGVEQH